MFSFIDKIREKLFKGKTEQEKRDRQKADIEDGKSKPVKHEKWPKRFTKIHRGGMTGGSKTASKLTRKMSRRRTYGGAAELALRKSAAKRLEAKRA